MRREPWQERIERHAHREGDCLIWTGARQRLTPRIGVNGRVLQVRTLIAREMGLPVSGRRAQTEMTCGTPLCVEPRHLAFGSQRNIDIATRYWARVSALRELADTLESLAAEYGLTRQRVQQIAHRFHSVVAPTVPSPNGGRHRMSRP